MFQSKKPKQPNGGIFANLTKKQQKQVDAAIIAAKGDPEKPVSVQASIPYLAFAE